MRIIKKWLVAMIPVFLLCSSTASYGGLLDDLKQLKKEVSKTMKKVTEPTDSTTKEKPEDNSNRGSTKTTNDNFNNKFDKKQTTSEQPDADADAAFRQLPEEIQNRIIDEGTKAQRKCALSGPVSFFYSCDCVKDEFINARTIQGPNTSYYNMYKETLNKCVSPEAITESRYDKCVVDERHMIKKVAVDTYCKCYSETMASKFVERPYYTLNFLGLLHKESRKECNYNSYAR